MALIGFYLALQYIPNLKKRYRDRWTAESLLLYYDTLQK